MRRRESMIRVDERERIQQELPTRAQRQENRSEKWMKYRPFIVLAIGVLLWLSTRRHRSEPFQPPPGCRDTAPLLPRPLIVVSAGGQRAGSTMLYNALRILMRIRDPNTISGWHQDLTNILDQYGHEHRNSSISSAAALRSTGTSVLVKVHHVADWAVFQWGSSADMRGNLLRKESDLVFTSHRDVCETVASVRRMGWGQYIRASDLNRDDFCVLPHRGRRGLVDSDYERPNTWVLQAKAILSCRKRLLDAAGSNLAEDFEMRDLVNLDSDKAIKLLSTIAKHLEFAYTNEQIKLAASELLTITAPKCNGVLNVHPVTHLHRSHINADHKVSEVEEQGIRAIKNDAQLAKWLRDNGYHPRAQVNA